MIKLYTILSSLLFMLPFLAVSQEDRGMSPDISQEVAPKITSQEISKNGDLTSSDTSAQKEELKARLPLNALRNFAEAFNRISSAYVEEIDDRSLLENAIRGMLFQLEPHSLYESIHHLHHLDYLVLYFLETYNY